jgi:hypothetical protein
MMWLRSLPSIQARPNFREHLDASVAFDSLALEELQMMVVEEGLAQAADSAVDSVVHQVVCVMAEVDSR